MPIVHVAPSAPELLQEVANTLGKSKKIVVVTGAGISTNSGIPDFRSQNGLYSLIQAQFDRASHNNADQDDSNDPSFNLDGPPAKRRRISQDQTHAEESQLPSMSHNTLPPSPRPQLPRHLTEQSLQSSASEGQDSIFSNHQLSSMSSQMEELAGAAPSTMRKPLPARRTPRRMLLGDIFSSSPLSSPPPILFDPYENTNISDNGSSRQSPVFSDASDDSDTEDTQPSVDLLSSQNSSTSLRTMKGRDLFDVNVWSDPVKTSVFYQFATSLRQRVRDVEPTTTHHFIARLRDNGKLARVYTQNIDEIEKKIGLSTDLHSGAGSKRRKSAKQQVLEPEKDTQSVQDESKAHDATELSNNRDEQVRTKPRRSLVADKGVECVFLHGSLQCLRCFVCGKTCDWDEEDREACTLSGQQPECPHCAGATAARQERGKRALGVGKLRPDIVLYGEEHPQSDLISPIVQHDLSVGPDLLLVLGTSLRVHGLKVMVKEFAKSVHNKGGKVVFINFTRPSESAWGDIIDYWIEWDCDAWVDDLRDRKPQLWLSPEEAQEQEKQKREAIAEKRRESMLKREATNEKKKQEKPPPANPKSDRNDPECGAYVVWKIFETLAKIGDRPFDSLGYVPSRNLALQRAPSPDPIRPMPQDKEKRKPRKSAPAALGCSEELDTEKHISGTEALPNERSGEADPRPDPRPESTSKERYAQAASKLARSSKIDTAARLAQLSQSPTPAPSLPDPPAVCEDAGRESIGASIKSRPRTRKPKRFFGDVEAEPSMSQIPPSSRAASPRVPAPTSSANTLPGPLLPSPAPYLEPPFQPAQVDRISALRTSLCNSPPSQTARRLYELTPMEHSDPLRRWSYSVNYNTMTKYTGATVVKTETEDATDPSDQLQREEREAASVLEGLKFCGPR